MTRPVSLVDFVARFEPACASPDEAVLEVRWYRSSCRSLVARVEELGDLEERKLGFVHLLNVLFGATPV